MPSPEHEKQNEIACRWLKKQGFSVVASNVWAGSVRERFDVLGFRAGCSINIESKVSKSDFRADKKKPERMMGSNSVGTYRFYILPVGMIDESEIPKGWGALFTDGKKVVSEVKPLGNEWPRYDKNDCDDWSPFQHKSNPEFERSILFSLCRRLLNKESIRN